MGRDIDVHSNIKHKLDEIKNQHAEVLSLEQKVNELHAIFEEFAVLLQG